MRLQDWVRRLLLAAVWGFSFIFMRVLAPVLGPATTTTVRIFGAGLLMGVALVCSDYLRADPPGGQAAFLIAIAFYGMGAVLIRRHAGDIPPTVLAGGTQFMGGLATVPLAFALAPDVAAVEQAGLTKIRLNAAALILLCSVLTYTLYYRLLRDVGPARTTTVTLLIPLFALLWSVVFLHESATPAMLAGGALVLLSTVLAIKR
ncbi:MAG: DMT family transporter [Candidatus Protistobacter heckmanni]|nr:DMT family transporter [Candidatus Protistobacter heckmanni]